MKLRHGAVPFIVMTKKPHGDNVPADLPTDWWGTTDVLRYLETLGRPMTRSTWSSYVARGQAPAPERRYGAYPQWRPITIKEWAAPRKL